MNWKVGDRAILVKSTEGFHVGHVVDILGSYTLGAHNGTHPAGTSGYKVMCCGENYFCPPNWLRPIPDDKHKRFHKALISTEWSDCAFNPMVTVQTGLEPK